MDRTYRLKHQANIGKVAKTVKTIRAYRATACIIASVQWRLFFEQANGFNKNTNIKHIESVLSERYKQTCQYQVVGTLESFISNRQNDFARTVHRSSLSDSLKHKLFVINKHGLWQQRHPLSTILIEKIKGKGSHSVKPGVTIDEESLKLSRKVFNHILSKHRKPSFERINMALDSKVALVSEKESDRATAFDYWLRLSTVEKGNPVYIPIESNGYYESIYGKRKNFCQVNLNRDGEVSVSFVKDVPKDESYIPETPKIAIDLGLSTLFATDRGNLLGRDFMQRLMYYDSRIAPLAANRQMQGLSVRSPRYDKRVREYKAFLKNEINRLLNRIIVVYKPAMIVIEKIDFTSIDLSKRMNRLLSWFGKSIIKEKLESLSEKYGIVITYVNPSYSSQQCSICGYVDKANRVSQPVFKCKCCNTSSHADVNAARNHLARSSDKVIDIYKSNAAVLRILTERFLSNAERTPRLYSKAKGLLPCNPYFKGYMAQPKGFL